MAYALIDAMEFTKPQMDELQLEIQNSDSPDAGAQNWVEQNRDVVEPWINTAKKAQS